MSLIQNKNDIFNEIGAFTSIKENATNPISNFNSTSSINNSNDTISFLLDILSSLVGSSGIIKFVGDIFTDFLSNTEPQLKETIINDNSTFNSDSNLPNSFNNGYVIPISQLDLYNKYKTPPTTLEGQLIYNENPNDFDRKAYEALSNPNVDIETNAGVTLNYQESTDDFIVKPINSNQNVGDFIATFIGGIFLISQKIFLSEILDKIFGSSTAKQNKPIEQIIEEEKNDLLLNKLLNEEEIEFNSSELLNIQNSAKEKKNGVRNLDFGCGILTTELSFDDYYNNISSISGSTNPQQISIVLTNTFDNSFNNLENNQNINKDASKDGFFKRLINLIKNLLLKSILFTPQMRLFYILIKSFKNNGNLELNDNRIDDIKNVQNLANCAANNAKVTITEYSFNAVKKELLEIILPAQATIIREKINNYIQIIKSLISI
ncbi:MAG: hypothetical protein ACOC33_00170 [bacterium]